LLSIDYEPPMHTPKSARKTAALLTVFALALGVCACSGSQENHGDAAPKQPALHTKQAGKPSRDHGDNRTAKKETHAFH